MGGKNCLHRQGKDNAGGVLLMALITVMTVGMLMAIYLSHSSAVTRRHAHSIELKQSFYLAEAGLAEAFAGLAIGKTGSVGTEAAPAIFGQGLFWVEATDLDDIRVQLDSTAMVGQTRAELSLVAERGELSVAALGIFGGDGIDIQPGSVVDAYDSDKGPYGKEMAVGLSRIGSNGPITLTGTLKNPTRIVADVMAGPLDGVTIDGEVMLLGKKGIATATTDLPEVTLPEVALDPGGTQKAGPPLVIPEGTTGLVLLHVTKNGEVVVQGPAQVLIETLILDAGASLEFDTSGGAVDLFVTRQMSLLKGSNVITTGGDPSLVSMQVAGALLKPITLASTSAFHGVFYAPLTEVQVANSFDIYGALVGKTLTFTGAAQLHFDAKLQRIADELALPAIVSWRILELTTDSDVFGTGGDPFEILGVAKGALTTPALSHEDQALIINYLDGGGSFQAYNGLESGFDWSDVTVPLDVERDGQNVKEMGAAAGLDPVAAEEAALADLIATGATSAEVKSGLTAASPLNELTLLSAIDDPNALSSAHLYAVLKATPNLSDAILQAAIADNTLNSGHMTTILQDNAPVTAAVLSAVNTRSSVMMAPADLMMLAMLPIK